MKRSIIKRAIYLLGASVAVAAAPAWAQDAADDDGVWALDEIIVTAQKRAENQQTVPISVSIATADFMAKNDIRTLEDLNGSVPGFFATNSVAYNTAPVSIRGIGGSTGSAAFMSDAPVASYVDGVYVARTVIPTTNLQDVESIQILRGPQGTLYGRNSTAGAILLTTKRAHQEFEAEVFAGYARFDEINVGAIVNGALTDTLSARAVIAYSDKAGFGVNVNDGSSVNGSQDLTARLSLNFEPSDAVSFDLIAELYHRKAQPGLLALSTIEAGGGTTNPYILRPDLDQIIADREYSALEANRSDSKTYAVTLLGEWDLDAVSVHSITGYRNLDFQGAQDTDNTPLFLFRNEAPIQSKQFSQELRLESNNDGPFSWILGGFYFAETMNISARVRLARSLAGLGVDANVVSEQKTNAVAIFGDGTYELTEKLSLTLGWRYSYEQKTFNTDRFDRTITAGTVPGGPFAGTYAAGEIWRDAPFFESQASYKDFSPRAVLDFQASEDVFLYASYSQGFKSGGFNTFTPNDGFGPESITSYEIGFKSEMMDNRVRLNGAAFYNKYSDLQIRSSDAAFNTRILNAGVARAQGAELELSFAVTEHLTISGNVAYLDAEFTNAVITAVPSTIGVVSAGQRFGEVSQDVSGNKLPRSPEWQSYLNISYERPVGSVIMGLNATYKYQDDVFYLETNQDVNTFVGEAWSEIDLRLEISDPDDMWEVAIYGQNVTNNRRLSFAATFGGFPTGVVSEPAKWGIETVFRF